MRKSILCAAGLAVAIVAADHVVAHGSATPPDQKPTIVVNRALKGDRAPVAAPLIPVTVVPKRENKADEPAVRMPEGCEAAVSPLSKAAQGAPPARCLARATVAAGRLA